MHSVRAVDSVTQEPKGGSHTAEINKYVYSTHSM